jgi:hypothetical protein
METAALVLVVVGMLGFLWWLFSTLGSAYLAEREAQPPEVRSSPLTVIAVALLIVTGAALLTGDARTGFRLALAGLALLALWNAVRSRLRR